MSAVAIDLQATSHIPFGCDTDKQHQPSYITIKSSGEL